MSWSGTATSRFAMKGPQSTDLFDHADFDSLITSLDGFLLKGFLGAKFSSGGGDISANNNATPTIVSQSVTVPSGSKHILVIGRIGGYNTATASNAYMNVYIQRDGSTLTQQYIWAQDSTTNRPNVAWCTPVWVDQPSAGSHSYSLAVNVSGTGTSADGRVKNDANIRRAMIAVFEL